MRYLKLTFVLPLMLLFAACSGGEKQNTQTQTDNNSEKIEEVALTDNVRTIHIYGINKMKYVVDAGTQNVKTAKKVTPSNGKSYMLLENIQASPGEKLHIVLTTISTFPAAAMSHDWTLLKMGTDPAAFAKAAMQAKANDYIPKGKENQIIAHTEMASGGETVEVTFTVPEKTGEYDYLCLFPAHYAAGMHGKLIVE